MPHLPANTTLLTDPQGAAHLVDERNLYHVRFSGLEVTVNLIQPGLVELMGMERCLEELGQRIRYDYPELFGTPKPTIYDRIVSLATAWLPSMEKPRPARQLVVNLSPDWESLEELEAANDDLQDDNDWLSKRLERTNKKLCLCLSRLTRAQKELR